MSNVVQLRKSNEYHGIAHRVTLSLVPPALVEKLFYAAISVGWAAGEEEYSSANDNAAEKLEDLRALVSEASQYTVPIDFQTGEPWIA